MGRRPRTPFESELVHVYTRGNNRAAVFRDDFDYVAWLRILERALRRYGVECHAYCLLPNHYHLLLRGSREEISRVMRHVNGSYAQRINVRYDRTGHVFEGPYHEELIADQAHLLEVCCYIPLNPVRARLSRRPEHWTYSSYRATAGLEHRPPFLIVSFTRSLFGRGDGARERYRAFVADGIASARDMSRDQVRG
ncbi:MAG TPA: transposase, partial [Gaiellaceae bacterium]|nr:transposase [Gaiellaceae bacterium]